jgi:hypothetical protein
MERKNRVLCKLSPFDKIENFQNSSKLLILAKKRLPILSNLSTKNHIRLF